MITQDEYQQLYKESLEDPNKFWAKVATATLTWSTPFTKVYEPGPRNPFDGFHWFSDGRLNGCHNAVDRHALVDPDRLALIWEPAADSPQHPTRRFTYSQLLQHVTAVAAYLRRLGVHKGDRVCIYMPTLPEAIFTMLACARLGAVHNVVFAALGWEALLARIVDSESAVVVVANGCRVADSTVVRLKDILDEALEHDIDKIVKTVVVLKHINDDDIDCKMTTDRDVWWHDAINYTAADNVCEPVMVMAEDPLFYLYTSGSTGKPKAMVHTTGGYLTFAAYTFQVIFDIQKGDRFFTTSDIGWVSAHSYGLYGPLCCGITVIMMESTCHYPHDSGRPWTVITGNKATHMYTSPTVLRALQRKHTDSNTVPECNSLRVLGCAGEPLDGETRRWYDVVVGRQRCPIVDTYWQTESGGVLLCTFPFSNSGDHGQPFMGVEPFVVPLSSDNPSMDRGVGALVFKRPWPGLARTIHGAHDRYRASYLVDHPGYYSSGDGASIHVTHNDNDNGNDNDDDVVVDILKYRIHGRIDDVINVGPVRFATAEIEGTLCQHPLCSEAAVLGMPDSVYGECVVAFCCLNDTSSDDCNGKKSRLDTELKELVSVSICELAMPRRIYIVSDLPRTRSGKIMRRLLRQLVHKQDHHGDLSTLVNPECIKELQDIMK